MKKFFILLVISILIISYPSSNLSSKEGYKSLNYSAKLKYLQSNKSGTYPNKCSTKLQLINLKSGPQSSVKHVFIIGNKSE